MRGMLMSVPDPMRPAWAPAPAGVPDDTRAAAVALTRAPHTDYDTWFWINARDGRVYGLAAPWPAPAAAPMAGVAVDLAATPSGAAVCTDTGTELRWRPAGLPGESDTLDGAGTVA